MSAEEKAIGIVVLSLILFLLVGWIFTSKMEANAFNRVTGKSVSTFDAMFIELRVQEQSK